MGAARTTSRHSGSGALAGLVMRACRRAVARVRRTHGIYEAGIIFLVLLGIEWITPGPATLARIAPHPFWISVILVSVQYGSASGLAAAGLATALANLAGWPPQTTQEDFYTYSMRVWREPILWIIAALVVGGLRSRQIRDRQALEERLQATEEQRNALGEFCSELQAELSDFERATATALSCPVEAALDVLHDLRSGSPAAARDRLPSLVACWLGEARWSLHRLQGGGLHLFAASSPPREADGPAVPNLDLARLHAAARVRGRPLSVFDAREAELLDGIGIYACDVRSEDRSASLGLLVVKGVEPGRLMPATATALAILAEAVGTLLAREEAPGESRPTSAANHGEGLLRVCPDISRTNARPRPEAVSCAS